MNKSRKSNKKIPAKFYNKKSTRRSKTHKVYIKNKSRKFKRQKGGGLLPQDVQNSLWSIQDFFNNIINNIKGDPSQESSSVSSQKQLLQETRPSLKINKINLLNEKADLAVNNLLNR